MADAEVRRQAAPPVDRPTVPGWYWFRETDTEVRRWTIVRVFAREDGELRVWRLTAGFALPLMAGEWRGPLAEPEG